jgi:cytochrome P450
VTVTDEFEYDPFSPAAMGDPLPIYRILRDHYPVYYADLPANCKVAIEEVIRFCGPAQWFLRTVRKDTVIAGTTVRAGQRVAWLTQSAGQDPREFEDPDEFRWNRPIRRTLAFGLGQHYCIGVHLARLEGRVLLEEFLRRVTDFEIDLNAAVRHPSSFQWGYNELPVVINSYE